MTTESRAAERELTMPVDGIVLHASLAIPPGAKGIVLFAHGSGSGRFSPRNRAVAATLQQAGFATLLMDLLTRDEERVDEVTRELRFDIGLLAARLELATAWVTHEPTTRMLPVGYFGASTGAAAALVAAARLPQVVRAVVSRGGRPDLAGDALAQVRAPTLLLVGGADTVVLGLNHEALELIRTTKQLAVVPHATHLFEEPGALEQVARLASGWFARHLVHTPHETAHAGSYW